MKVQEAISKIEVACLYALWMVNDYYEPLKDCKCVAEGLNLDEHRWYSIATNVYECEDGFVGVRGVYQSFSEMQTWEDINVLCTAEEYIAVPSITYKPKNS